MAFDDGPGLYALGATDGTGGALYSSISGDAPEHGQMHMKIKQKAYVTVCLTFAIPFATFCACSQV